MSRQSGNCFPSNRSTPGILPLTGWLLPRDSSVSDGSEHRRIASPQDGAKVERIMPGKRSIPGLSWSENPPPWGIASVQVVKIRCRSPYQEEFRSGYQSYGIFQGFGGIASLTTRRFPVEVKPSRRFRPGSWSIGGGGADGNCFLSIPPSRQGRDPFGKVSPN